MKRICLIAALLVGSASAQDVNQPTESKSFFYEGTHFGLALDAGFPAGATASVVVRPWSFLRLNAGIAHDVIAFGYKAGVTLIPFHWGVVPTLSFELGHFADGDVNSIITVNDPVVKELVKQIGYDYMSADLGLEFGSQNRFVFYVRGGLTKISSSARNLNAALAAGNVGGTATYTVGRDPSVNAVIPAARIGFIVYVF